MIAFRLTQEEYLYLSQAYSLAEVPPWLPERGNLPEEALLFSLEKKDLFLTVEDQYLPSPVVDFLFENMAAADYTVRIGDTAVCFGSEQVTVLVERETVGRNNRLLPFERAEHLIRYLKEREEPEPFCEAAVRKHTAEAQEALWQFNRLWREAYEC